jgi:tetratricopeptide (TPR) repeat protein
MMKRLLSLIMVCVLYLTADAQLDKEAVASYIDDVKAYEQAVKYIVKDHQYEDGVAVLTALIERCEKNQDYSHKELADYYSVRGQGQFHMNRFEQAVVDYRHALRLLTEAGEVGKSNLSLTWYKLAIAYYNMKKNDEAMDATNKCIQTAKDYYGPTHSETMDAYGLRSNIAGFYNKKEIALHDRQEIFNIIRQNIERNFVYLTTSERTAYWSKYQPETTIMFAFAHKMNERKSVFTDALFNQQLLAKGLLLTAESSLQRAIDI